LKLTVTEIERGKMDKSITTHERPELLYLVAWANCIGYIKLNAAAGRTATLHGVNIEQWKNMHLQLAKNILKTA